MMSQRENEFGQPIGEDVPNWTGAKYPTHEPMEGRLCRLEKINLKKHSKQLFDSLAEDRGGKLWTYMMQGPFKSEQEFNDWLAPKCESIDPLFYVIIERASNEAVGLASYLRIQPEHGVIEVGNIMFAPKLQKTSIATECMYLMMKRAFDELGYRRYEWKCDALNAPSRRAALRFGFHYDGTFEQAVIYKGRNRDTAWYSILDKNWPIVEKGFLNWLSPDNFDEKGIQKQKLSELINMGKAAN